tara:strand:+ start:623 stop:1063 length:441 start_codon:yes stop_codon:yes gene_type:complete
MKKGPFKLKSGNKPSMAQLSGVSPMKEMVDKGASKGKVNPFSAEYKRMTKSQRREKYNTRDEAGSFDKTKDTFNKIGSGKTGKIGNIGETVKNIVKSVTGDKKNKRDDNGSKGTTRSRFNTAFAKAKKEGLDIFEFEGKKYTTKTK